MFFYWLVLNMYLLFILIQKVPVTTIVLISISFVLSVELSALSDDVTYESNLVKYNVHYKTEYNIIHKV